MLLIRSADTSQLDELVSLYVRAFNAPPWNNGWTTLAAKERIAEQLAHPKAFCLAAWEGDSLVALLIGHSERWTTYRQFYIDEMCIAPERQRSGVGTTLLNELFAKLRTMEIREVHLHTAPATPAESFYLKCGFARTPLTSLGRRTPDQGVTV